MLPGDGLNVERGIAIVKGLVADGISASEAGRGGKIALQIPAVFDKQLYSPCVGKGAQYLFRRLAGGAAEIFLLNPLNVPSMFSQRKELARPVSYFRKHVLSERGRTRLA